MPFREIEEKYLEICNPKSIVEGMTDLEFILWLMLGTPQDVRCTFHQLELHELYEYATLARNYLIELN